MSIREVYLEAENERLYKAYVEQKNEAERLRVADAALRDWVHWHHCGCLGSLPDMSTEDKVS